MADSLGITHQQILDRINSSNMQLFGALSRQLSVITDNMVTKSDLREALQNYPTKEELKTELKAFATKDDLSRLEEKMATKDDLKAFATKDDLNHLESKLDQAVSRLERKMSSVHTANIKHHLETRRDIGQLNRELAEMRESW